jgi:hypothetical protein
MKACPRRILDEHSVETSVCYRLTGGCGTHNEEEFVKEGVGDGGLTMATILNDVSQGEDRRHREFIYSKMVGQ